MPAPEPFAGMDVAGATALIRRGCAALGWELRPGSDPGVPEETYEHLLRAHDRHPPHLLLAALAAASTCDGRFSRAAPLARWLAHETGCAGNVAEQAASCVARFTRLVSVPECSREDVAQALCDVPPEDLADLAAMRGNEELAGRISTCEAAPEHAGSPVVWGPHTLVVMVGLPGSGKTTWLSANLPGATVVSMDRMRQVVLGDAGDQSRNDEIFRRSMGALGAVLKSGRSVVFDATSVSRDRRGLPCRIARTHGAHVAMVFLDVSLDEARERNGRRARVVPDDVVVKMYRELEVPAAGEADSAFLVSPGLAQPIHWRPGEEYLRDAHPAEPSILFGE